MNNSPASALFVRHSALALTAVVVVGATPRLAAYKVDKYGGIHAEPHDIQQGNYERFQADKANSANRRSSGLGATAESGFATWARELRANEEAREEAARKAIARKEQEKIAAKEREAREERNFQLQLKNAEDKARQVAASKELDRQIAADIFERNYGEIVRSSTACLTAFRAGTPLPKEGSEKVAQAMLRGAFGWTPLDKIGLNYPESERYALALEIYRQREAPFNSHSWPAVTAHVALGQLGNMIDGTDDVHPFIDQSTGAHGFFWAPLAGALADKNSRLSADQRRLAIELLTAVVNSLPARNDEDGLAQARLLVAAAKNTPEIAQLPRIHTAFVPLVRGSIWAQGFTTPLAQPTAPLAVAQCGLTNGLAMALAQELVLSKRKEYPEFLLAKMRILRRKEGVGPASAAQLAFIQNALEGWMQRNAFDRRLEQRLQTEIELTLMGTRGQMDTPDLARWDVMLTDTRVETLRDPQYQMVRLYGQDPLRTGVTTFLLVAGPGMMSTYIDFACADPAPRRRRDFRGQWEYDAYLEKFNRDIPAVISFRAWYALHQLTNIPLAAGEKLPDLGVAKERWNDLVTAGEMARGSSDPQWNEPATVELLNRVRREILGETGAALARPKYSVKPGQAGRSLASLVPAGSAGIDPAIRKDVDTLLYQCRDATDPSTVLAVAQIRGPVLGDWARLAAWLDDPRRRPKNEKDPLQALYLAAIIERDLAAGLLGDVPAGPVECITGNERLQQWLRDVLAATGAARTKLLADHFPRIIQSSAATDSHPNLALLGYDVMRGGLASRALLLLCTPAFDPTGKLQKAQPFDVEPWLVAVAQLSRTATPETLVAELADNARTPRAHWISEGSQDALVRLASRWSPARAPAQAAILALAPKLVSPSANDKATVACIGARVRWEQAKMRGLDDADAFAEAAGPLYPDEVKALARLAPAEGKPHPLVLARDTHFAREASEAAKRPATARARPGRPVRLGEATKFARLVSAFRKKAYGESEQLRKNQAREQLLQAYDTVLSADACASLCVEDSRTLATYSKDWLIGTRARLAAVGSTDAADWLRRIEALPQDTTRPEIATALGAAVRARLRPEDITTQLLYIVANDKREKTWFGSDGARLVVRTLLAEPEAPRYFGLAWLGESSIPFKAEWLREILDQQTAETATDEFIEKRTAEQTALAASGPPGGGLMGQDKGDPVLNDYLAARREKQMRERVRRLTPKVAMLFAYSAKNTHAELVRVLVNDAPPGFIDSLAKLAAAEDPSLQPLLSRDHAAAAHWKPITVEQWELLAEGRLWPLPAGI